MSRGNYLSDGDPDGLAFVLGFDDLLLQALNPDAGVEHFADFAIFTHYLINSNPPLCHNATLPH